MLPKWPLPLPWGRHVTPGALGVRLMEFRAWVGEHPSQSILYSSGTRPHCAQGAGENATARPRSLCLTDATDVSALFLTISQELPNTSCRISLSCRRNKKDTHVAKWQPDRRKRVLAINPHACHGCHVHVGSPRSLGPEGSHGVL